MRAHEIKIATAAAAAGLAAFAQAPCAMADPPPLPPAPPYIPGDVSPAPGSFSYPYNVIMVPAPAQFDARGVNVTANVDPTQSMTGLPGSALGNSPPPPNSLTSSSALYGISGGSIPQATPNPGVNVGAGTQTLAAESPSGGPPANAPAAEAAAPTAAPGNPPPLLESPDGKPPSSN